VFSLTVYRAGRARPERAVGEHSDLFITQDPSVNAHSALETFGADGAELVLQSKHLRLANYLRTRGSWVQIVPGAPDSDASGWSFVLRPLLV
jgi:hypothetical protein